MEKESLTDGDFQDFKTLVNTAHTKSAEEVTKILKVDPNIGLSQSEAAIRLKAIGRNELPPPKHPSLWEQILEQFEDNLVRILLLAAVISLFIALTDKDATEWTSYVEPFVILLILVANATIGVWQEAKSERALDALLVLQANKTQVLREGKQETVDASEVVPGDICVLKGGDKVPADIRLIKRMALKVNQSLFTGESKVRSKDPSFIVNIPNPTNQDKKNMLFSSTEISAGEATGVVVGVGEDSQLGKIKQEIEKAAEENQKTPLKQRLDDFGNMLSVIIMVICGLAWLVNFPKFFDAIHGNWFRGAIYYFKIAVSLAVAAIPEGLPAVITTCLALATARMAENKAIVRQLASVETLGCTTIICSDKTGTLTVNKMTAVEISYIDEDKSTIKSHKIKGEGLDIKGEVEGLTSDMYMKNSSLQTIANISSLCNDARLKKNGDGSHLKVFGTSTEGSLRILLQKLSKYDKEFQDKWEKNKEDLDLEPYASYFEKQNPLVVKLPFTQKRKIMSVFVKGKQGKNILLVKGAPDMLLEKCTKAMLASGEVVEMSQEVKKIIIEKIKDASKKAYRCLGFAYKENLEESLATAGESQLNAIASQEKSYLSIENECTFVGYVGIKDPPRSEVPKAIEQCKTAGIKVIMITGDNKDTAVAIAKDLKLFNPEQEDEKLFIDGREFQSIATLEEKIERIKKGACVFSRVEPKHKREIVQILKDLHEIVAMTGDGVNDAAAIRQAHIGIAMGLSGTDVAKEASKLVLADDNFATIVMAVEEGRGIYTNIKAFIRYLISSNIGEVVAIFTTSLLGFPEVLSSVHLLWINLVTDGLPATALGFNPPEPDVMEQKPRKVGEHIISWWTLTRYFIIGTYVGLATIAIFIHWFLYMNEEDGHTLITFNQLRTWSTCPDWPSSEKNFNNFDGVDLSKNPCNLFNQGKVKASTLSLTVLVVIEMFNAMNALSETTLLRVCLWKNPWLCLAIFSSMSLHFMILYVPFFRKLFGVAALTSNEWLWVILYSFPIIIIDEIMKSIGEIIKSYRKRYGKIKAD